MGSRKESTKWCTKVQTSLSFPASRRGSVSSYSKTWRRGQSKGMSQKMDH